MLFRNPDGSTYQLLDLQEARKLLTMRLRIPASEFHERLGIPVSTYRLIERGERQPSVEHRQRIIAFFAENNIEITFPRYQCTEFTLKELRKAKGLTQAQVAEVLGISTVTYGSYERCTRRMTADHYWKLCDLFIEFLGGNLVGGGKIEGILWGRIGDDVESEW